MADNVETGIVLTIEASMRYYAFVRGYRDYHRKVWRLDDAKWVNPRDQITYEHGRQYAAAGGSLRYALKDMSDPLGVSMIDRVGAEKEWMRLWDLFQDGSLVR